MLPHIVDLVIIFNVDGGSVTTITQSSSSKYQGRYWALKFDYSWKPRRR